MPPALSLQLIGGQAPQTPVYITQSLILFQLHNSLVDFGPVAQSQHFNVFCLYLYNSLIDIRPQDLLLIVIIFGIIAYTSACYRT